MPAATDVNTGGKIGLGIMYSILYGVIGLILGAGTAWFLSPKYLGKAAMGGAALGIIYGIYSASTAKKVGNEIQ